MSPALLRARVTLYLERHLTRNEWEVESECPGDQAGSGDEDGVDSFVTTDKRTTLSRAAAVIRDFVLAAT
jgi:hypothetical protein